MIFIAHRGNIVGANPVMENHPSYIKYALQLGFDVEIDVWFIDGKFGLGHDKPQYEVGPEFFHNSKFWLHCKNIEALEKMVTHPVVNAFFHDQDDCTLTSQQYIWTYPKAKLPLTERSIAVMPERVNWAGLENCFGICTDTPIIFKRLFTK
jgi:hypothetical protein